MAIGAHFLLVQLIRLTGNVIGNSADGFQQLARLSVLTALESIYLERTSALLLFK